MPLARQKTERCYQRLYNVHHSLRAHLNFENKSTQTDRHYLLSTLSFGNYVWRQYTYHITYHYELHSGSTARAAYHYL